MGSVPHDPRQSRRREILQKAVTASRGGHPPDFYATNETHTGRAAGSRSKALSQRHSGQKNCQRKKAYGASYVARRARA